jgi:cystathionine beta-lyase/cystathionine gamma-synthase
MRSEAWEYGHHLVPPISTSATFRLDSLVRAAAAFAEYAQHERPDHHIYIYDRLREPNKDLLEEALADAEGGEMAVTFATGMAAISAAICTLAKAGDHIVVHQTMYGCTHSLISNWVPRYGIGVTEMDLGRTEMLSRMIRPETRVVYFETPANPNLQQIDIAAVASEVDRINQRRPEDQRIYTVVDNTFATPFCQRPISFGADFVVHSLTKGIGGFGTDMGGVVIGPESARDALLLYRKDFGGVLSSRAAWSILVHGLPTLPLRMQRMQETAGLVARFLSEHPAIARVRYPGLSNTSDHSIAIRQMRDYDGNFSPGSMIYFEIAGSSTEEQHVLGTRIINHLAQNAYTVSLAVSLGNVRTLVEHPSSMTHAGVPLDEQERMGIHPGGVRLSMGLEAADDILGDISRALAIAEESVPQEV